MSKFNVGELVVTTVDGGIFYKCGDKGVVVTKADFNGDYVVDFNKQGNAKVCRDGKWFCPESDLAPVQVTQGHSGRHDGLQNHSVGSCYPLSVVTYGHEPAIHVIENLTTGQVACLRTGHPWQFSSAGTAFTFLELLAAGGSGNYVLGPVVWVSGRPKNVNGILVVHESKHVLFNHAYNLEESRIGRPLTPYEVYQLACDIDNR